MTTTITNTIHMFIMSKYREHHDYNHNQHNSYVYHL